MTTPQPLDTAAIRAAHVEEAATWPGLSSWLTVQLCDALDATREQLAAAREREQTLRRTGWEAIDAWEAAARAERVKLEAAEARLAAVEALARAGRRWVDGDRGPSHWVYGELDPADVRAALALSAAGGAADGASEPSPAATSCPCEPFVEQLATAWDEGRDAGATYGYHTHASETAARTGIPGPVPRYPANPYRAAGSPAAETEPHEFWRWLFHGGPVDDDCLTCRKPAADPIHVAAGGAAPAGTRPAATAEEFGPNAGVITLAELREIAAAQARPAAAVHRNGSPCGDFLHCGRTHYAPGDPEVGAGYGHPAAEGARTSPPAATEHPTLSPDAEQRVREYVRTAEAARHPAKRPRPAAGGATREPDTAADDDYLLGLQDRLDELERTDPAVAAAAASYDAMVEQITGGQSAAEEPTTAAPSPTYLSTDCTCGHTYNWHVGAPVSACQVSSCSCSGFTTAAPTGHEFVAFGWEDSAAIDCCQQQTPQGTCYRHASDPVHATPDEGSRT